MDELLEHVEHSIVARRLMPLGEPVLVAVSGGVDSMVLLHLLAALSRKFRWRLTVAHLNHRLRGVSSAADERLVRRTATLLHLRLVVELANVRAFATSRRISLEMAARDLRHEFLARAALRSRSRAIVLAHHADDQVELFFLRLLRGSGGEGLAGMKWRSPSPANPRMDLVRPLLDIPKDMLRQYAAERHVPFREDASNASADMQRNRIRQELLPRLRRHQPALARTVLRAMEITAAEGDFVEEISRQWLEGAGIDLPTATAPPPGMTRCLRSRPSAKFSELPLAVQRRCLYLQLRKLKVPAHFDLVEQLRQAPRRRVNIPAAPGPSWVIRDTNGTLRIEGGTVLARETVPHQLELKGTSGGFLLDGFRCSWRTHPQSGARRPRARPGVEYFDADCVGKVLLLRHWRPGDRFQPIGMRQSVKLQDFFTNEKVPRQARHQLFVATTAQGEVFWVEGLRISERFKLTERTNRRLQWRWRRRNPLVAGFNL